MASAHSDVERLRLGLHRRMMKTVGAWDLIEPGDRIMVCVSGGKDSYTLLDLLWQARRRSPFPYEVIAVHLDQQQPGYDGARSARGSKPTAPPSRSSPSTPTRRCSRSPNPAAPTAPRAAACAAACSTTPPSASAATSSRSGTTATTRSRPR
ncbi:MAG: hypothetical protein H6705_09645 [Myxococcales bacterium]|nr:hypothetical protein [Myxococcales bacterium]